MSAPNFEAVAVSWVAFRRAAAALAWLAEHDETSGDDLAPASEPLAAFAALAAAEGAMLAQMMLDGAEHAAAREHLEDATRSARLAAAALFHVPAGRTPRDSRMPLAPRVAAVAMLAAAASAVAGQSGSDADGGRT